LWYFIFMSRPLENLSINPLFLDALSGEFRLMGDPDQTQSLGQLAVETFQKGELIVPRMGTRPGPVFYGLGYEPSWAPDAGVSVMIYELDDLPHVSAVSINRKEPGYGGISFVKSPFKSESSPLYLRMDQRSHERFSTIWPLELGPPLDEVRSAVTEAAQEFFAS
jgi:hypothetical protein